MYIIAACKVKIFQSSLFEVFFSKALAAYHGVHDLDISLNVESLICKQRVELLLICRDRDI